MQLQLAVEELDQAGLSEIGDDLAFVLVGRKEFHSHAPNHTRRGWTTAVQGKKESGGDLELGGASQTRIPGLLFRESKPQASPDRP